jgi:hypothetical protein
MPAIRSKLKNSRKRRFLNTRSVIPRPDTDTVYSKIEFEDKVISATEAGAPFEDAYEMAKEREVRSFFFFQTIGTHPLE